MLISIEDFRVGYFPPWDMYYISNRQEVYLTKAGRPGPVAYWKTQEAAKATLTKFNKAQEQETLK